MALVQADERVVLLVNVVEVVGEFAQRNQPFAFRFLEFGENAPLADATDRRLEYLPDFVFQELRLLDRKSVV